MYRSILLPGARVGRGAAVRNAIVDAYGEIRAGDEIGYRSALDGRRFDLIEAGLTIVGAQRTVTVVSDFAVPIRSKAASNKKR